MFEIAQSGIINNLFSLFAFKHCFAQKAGHGKCSDDRFWKVDNIIFYNTELYYSILQYRIFSNIGLCHYILRGNI